jgi:hypothetical protein
MNEGRIASSNIPILQYSITPLLHNRKLPCLLKALGYL